jgi:hypothetical protein
MYEEKLKTKTNPKPGPALLGGILKVNIRQEG